MEDGKEHDARMHTCAFCGQRLPWLHRVAGSRRYCSKECARRHLEAGQQGDAEAPGGEPAGLAAALPENRLDEQCDRREGLLADSATPAQTREMGEAVVEQPRLQGGSEEEADATAQDLAAESVPLLRASAQERRDEVASTARAGDGGSGLAQGSTDPEAEALPGGAGAQSGAPHAGPQGFRDEEPDGAAGFEPPLAGMVRLQAAPGATEIIVRSQPRPWQPRRRVIAPAHRVRPRALSLALAGAARMDFPAAGAWNRLEAGSGSGASQGSGSFSSCGRMPADDALAVLIVSFGDDAGRGSAATARTARPGPEPAGPRPPFLRERVRPLAAPFPATVIPQLQAQPCKAGRGLRPQPLQRVATAGLRLADLRLLGGVAASRVIEPLAEIQPFRLHRMPLRPLRIGPLRIQREARLAAQAALAFAPAVLVPKARNLPLRPAYVLMAPPQAAGGVRPAGMATAPGEIRPRRG